MYLKIHIDMQDGEKADNMYIMEFDFNYIGND